jgi:hypothetical protein
MTEQPKPEELTPDKALQYIGELVGEYMKTLPPTIRMPVVQTVNACLGNIGKEVQDAALLRGQLEKLKKAKGK